VRANTILSARHRAVPALEILEVGELRRSAVQVIAENAVQVVIDEERAIGN